MNARIEFASVVVDEYRRRLAAMYWAAFAGDAQGGVIGPALALTAELVAAGRMSEHARAEVLAEVMAASVHAESDEYEFDDPIWHEVVLAGWV